MTSQAHLKSMESILNLMQVGDTDMTHLQVIKYKDHVISWLDFSSKVRKLANFIAERINGPTAVGIMMETSSEHIWIMTAIMESGCYYVPIDPALPYLRKKSIIQESGLQMLFTDIESKELDFLHWSCEKLRVVIRTATTSDDLPASNERQGSRELWLQVGMSATNLISAGGWKSSFTDQDFSEDEMSEYVENTFQKLEGTINVSSSVLEVGCSSGLTLLRIAPLVRFYMGTDFAGSILQKTQHKVSALKMENVKLMELEAIDIDRIDDKFDVVIINSVIQYFESYDYLKDVIKKAIRLLNDNGVLFIGDVLNLDDQEVFFKDLLRDRLSGNASVRLEQIDHLYFSPAFFEGLAQEIDGITNVSISKKQGKISNELRDYRFDVVMTVRGIQPQLSPDSGPQKRKVYLQDIMVSESSVETRRYFQDVIYQMYVSQAMGPVAVSVSREALINYCRGAQKRGDVTQHTVSLLLSSLSYDFSYGVLWSTILTGGRVVLVDNETMADPSRIVELISRESVTQLKTSPTSFKMLVEKFLECDHGQIKSLRRVMLGGEMIDGRDVQTFLQKFPDVDIINEYGTIETTVGAIQARVGIDNQESFCARPVIGQPINGARVLIVNEKDRQVPVNVVGEILIGGPVLANGYARQPDLTDRYFIVNPLEKSSSQKFYRTGDLGRWLNNGQIELAGSKDTRVKLRGYRVDLREIEVCMTGLFQIESCLAALLKDEESEMLVAAYTGKISVDAVQMQSVLTRYLPPHMIPNKLFAVEELPLRTSGYVNPLFFSSLGLDSKWNEYIAPRNSTEQWLVNSWAELFRREKIGVTDNFHKLGGQSLKAMRLISMVHKQYGVNIVLKEFFLEPTIEFLARKIEEATTRSHIDIQAIEDQEYYPVSYSQRRVWLFNQFKNAAVAYNNSQTYTLTGHVDAAVLKSAFNKVVWRHDSLRTSFVVVGNNIKQRVCEPSDFDFEINVVDAHKKELNKPDIEGLVRAEAEYYFDLSRPPLFRATLVKVSSDEFAFCLTVHHIVADGMSMSILNQEVLEAYRNERDELLTSPAPLLIQYKDFAIWQSAMFGIEMITSRAREYWSKQFEQPLTVLDFPADYRRPPLKTYNSKGIKILIPPILAKKTRQLALKNSASVFITLFSVIKTLLHRYSGNTDIVLGIPIVGREHDILKDQIGIYINTLAIRTQVLPEVTFLDLLTKVNINMLEAYENQLYPFDVLVEKLNLARDLSRSPVFDMLVVSKNMDIAEHEPSQSDEAGFSIQGYQNEFSANKFDVTFYLEELDDSISIDVQYNIDVFREDSIKSLVSNYLSLLEKIIERPNARLVEYDFVNQADQKMLLRDFNATANDFQTTITINQAFEETAKKYPHTVAVIDAIGSTSYSYVDTESNKLANYLLQRGVGHQFRVGVMVDRNVDLIITVLAILKTGACYVPLDPKYPQDFIRNIIDDSGITHLVTTQNYESAFPSLDVVVVSEVPTEMATTPPLIAQNSTDIAYIIYTSGSTGKPKGVIITHVAVVNLVTWVNRTFSVSSDDRLLFVTSICFDLSVYDIFGILIAGGTVVCAEIHEVRNPELIHKIAIDHDVTFWDSVPTTMNYFVDAANSIDNGLNKSLRLVFMSGDWIPVQLPAKIKARFPKADVISLGGATECTVWSNYYPITQVDPEWRSIPYGRPIDNSSFYILNEALRPVPKGAVGELYIGGVGVAVGYANNIDKTMSGFVPDPFWPESGNLMYRTGDLGRMLPDNNMEFLGRKDFQLKIRGFRVEAGDVENAILTIPGIENAVVVGVQVGPSRTFLAAYVTASVPINPDDVKAIVANILPDYMVPGAVIVMDELPLNANGKIDRKKLPAPDEVGVAKHVIPLTSETEIQLAIIWSEILSINKIDANVNFFDLGGHSLKMAQLKSKIDKEFDVDLDIELMFESPMLKQMALHIDNSVWFKKSSDFQNDSEALLI